MIAIQISESRLECIHKILNLLPAQNINLLSFLIIFLKLVAQNSDINKMTSSNLAMVFAPNLLRSSLEDVNMSIADNSASSAIMISLIDNYSQLFVVSVLYTRNDVAHYLM
jgi:hypothetical protein